MESDSLPHRGCLFMDAHTLSLMVLGTMLCVCGRMSVRLSSTVTSVSSFGFGIRTILYCDAFVLWFQNMSTSRHVSSEET